MKFIKLTMVSFFLLFLVGCAVGNRYDYRQANISLPVTGNEILGAGVIDMRSYVLNKDKTPDFIGILLPFMAIFEPFVK